MAGKGSRQRTYGRAFEANYDRIFGRKEGEVGTEWVAPDSPSEPAQRKKACLDQYPQEAREDAQRRSQGRSWDAES